MSRFLRLDVLNAIVDGGLVPVFYHGDQETARAIARACSDGGCRLLEFTNRGDHAPEVFRDLSLHVRKELPRTILGCGSVVDEATAALYIAYGADFVVGPVLNPAVARLCNRRKVAYLPGCGTASEISQAEELGAEIAKIFPGDSVGGPAFVKSILAPMPWSRIMPTGGVEASRESIQAWFKAGVAAVGIGSHLIRKEWVEAGDWAAISAATARVLGWIREARGAPLFLGLEHAGITATADATADRIAAWYADMFGLQLKDAPKGRFVQGAGPGRIEVLSDPGPHHLAIAVTDLDAAMADLRERGVELGEIKGTTESKRVYLTQTDPAGNRVHLVWRK